MSQLERIEQYVTNVKKMRQEWMNQEWETARQKLGIEESKTKFIEKYRGFSKSYPKMAAKILSFIEIPENQRAILEEKENIMLDKQLEYARTGQTFDENKNKSESFDVFMPEIKASLGILSNSKSVIEKMIHDNAYLGTCLVIEVGTLDRKITSHKFCPASDLQISYKDHVTGEVEKPGIAILNKGNSYTKWINQIKSSDYRTYYPIAIIYVGSSEPPILAEVEYPWLRS